MHTPADRILHRLKTRGPSTTAAVARHLDITPVGARKHLTGLERQGLVQSFEEKGRVGRPRRLWALTQAAQARFPDNHSFLTLELIEAARAAFGEEGIERLIAGREATTGQRYEARMRGRARLDERLAELSRLRTEEGYMSEWSSQADGSLLLVENHCPICAAAKLCRGFCRSELDLFRRVLGPDALVERTDHALAGARRCAYVVRPRPPEGGRS